jgi:hypothetical protein
VLCISSKNVLFWKAALVILRGISNRFNGLRGD